MNTPQIRKATRRKAKLRLGISAPSGAGKTMGALYLALGIGGKIGMIDTEHGSGELYSDLVDYDVISIAAPYTIKKYLEAIKAFEDAGYNTVIMDSISHAWAGDGGLLDKQGKIAEASKSGNSYTAWRTVTPEHNAFIEAMLKSSCHIIATMRSKTEYVQERGDNGKTTIRKVGLAPIQRDGMEYEFTVMLDIDLNHTAYATKDRTNTLDGQYFTLSPTVGRNLLKWLETGEDAPPSDVDVPQSDVDALCRGIEATQDMESATAAWREADAQIRQTGSEDDAKVVRKAFATHYRKMQSEQSNGSYRDAAANNEGKAA